MNNSKKETNEIEIRRNCYNTAAQKNWENAQKLICRGEVCNLISNQAKFATNGKPANFR